MLKNNATELVHLFEYIRSYKNFLAIISTVFNEVQGKFVPSFKIMNQLYNRMANFWPKLADSPKFLKNILLLVMVKKKHTCKYAIAMIVL